MNEHDRIAKILELLANPMRAEIAYMLSKESMIAGAIAPYFGLPATTVSTHLRKMEAGGLLGRKRLGQYVVYYTKPNILTEAIVWLEIVRDNIKDKEKNEAI